MRLLIIIGAGASYDCWPFEPTVPTRLYEDRIPLAKYFFSLLPNQNGLLRHYDLMSLASIMRTKAKVKGNAFDIEFELEQINEKANQIQDRNTIFNLFKTRFYIHRLISELTEGTINRTSSHTVYIDLINSLKNWIDDSPKNRFVDIVVFNYDNLVEKAMASIYSFDWREKHLKSPLTAYYMGNNLKIYKPHGSIDWGREILKDNQHYYYSDLNDVFIDYDKIKLSSSFQFIDQNAINNPDIQKNYIPAIAIPFKNKTDFNECPSDMLYKMIEAVNDSDKILTLGWKGTERHFTSLIGANSKADELIVVSTSGKCDLEKYFTDKRVTRFESTFQHFVSDSFRINDVLNTLEEIKYS